MSGNEAPWTRFYPATVSPELVGKFPTMLAAWRHQVAERPDSPAVHYFDATLTFAELDRVTDALACALRDQGLQRGDRVALYLQNDPQFLVGLVATWKLGAVPVAVSPMSMHKELAHHLLDSGATVLLCLESLYADVAAEVVGETAVTTVVTTHPLDLTPHLVLPGSLNEHVPDRRCFDATVDLRSLVEKYDGQRPDHLDLEPGDIGILTYTSGTTGRSKGALNLHSAMSHSSSVYAAWWDIEPERDVILCLAPVFHITGIIAGFGLHICTGAPLVLLHRFDTEETLRAIQDRRCTFVVAASTAFIALSNHPNLHRYDVSSLTKTPSGGAAVSKALVERVHAATGWALRGAYGMTETNSPTHLGPPDVDPPVDEESGALSVGVPVPGCRVQVVDPVTGDDVGPDEMGEIVVSGPMVVPGYWQLPEESAHAVRDGWLHTGDVGKQTKDGWLFVVDRLKDMINAGGYKVFPRDVEDVLFQHPAVREASVVGVPDEYRGETVKAFVSLVEDQRATPEELIAFCRDRMAAYKYPRLVEILDELPKNASGKILRRQLRES